MTLLCIPHREGGRPRALGRRFSRSRPRQIAVAAKSLSAVLALGTGVTPSARAGDAVRMWEDTRTIPTYEEGLPDVNPPFDLLSAVRFNYPYTMRENLTDRRSPRVWRTLNLENEYLLVAVVPDMGGRLLSCVDKTNGAEMFYANPSFKFAQVAYRGAWATFGIEFNFPVSHNWVTSSPVDFATVRHPDGSASIVVGNVDLVYGMQWRVELTLRPGRAELEQTTTLYNRSDLRHRFYWWTNAAVQVWDDSHLIYPMDFTASHGFTEVDTWPVNTRGVDLSRPGNHKDGPVSLFSHGSHEGFMGVWHPRTKAGVAHYSDPAELPAKKVWSWGGDADGLDWRRALSDNDSAEAEIQAGLFRNQETYAFLQPQERIRFTEHWLPVRAIGGVSRATPEAVLLVERAGRAGASSLTVGLNVTQRVSQGRLRILDGDRALREESLGLDPTSFLLKAYPGLPPAERYTVEVAGRDGRVLIRHTEGVYDNVPKAEVSVGPQPSRRRPIASRTDLDFAEVGGEEELQGQILAAYATYEDGLHRFPNSFAIEKAAGRLAVQLKRYEEAVRHLEAAGARMTQDPEIAYLLGCAYEAMGEHGRAVGPWEAAAHFRSTRPAALTQLARLRAREGDTREALDLLRQAFDGSPGLSRAGAWEVILLRRSGERDRAAERLAFWRLEDPTSSTLRNEAVKLGQEDEGLWRHLAGDPQRVLEVAIDYMEIGAYDDALELLAREYPRDGVVGEPGAVLPQSHPEVAYYRAFCRERLGQDPKRDDEAAAGMSTTYVFPHRPQTLPVLGRALKANPNDATAHFLLGSLYLSGGMADRAIHEWEETRRLEPRRAVLHRNLGLTLIQSGGDLEHAREVLTEGLSVDPTNSQVYLGLDQALELLGRPAADRVASLQSYPDLPAMPPVLVFKLALALAEEGRFDEAERLFAGRFFPREEFGTNVRAVWLEVRLQRALALAVAGKAMDALVVVQSLGEPVPGLEFTRCGLGAFIEEARVQDILAEIHTRCGLPEPARQNWKRAAAAGDGFPFLAPVFAYRAARRLGPVDEEAWRARFERSIDSIDVRLVVGTSYPGLLACARGLLLQALGRADEAGREFQKALLLPDRRLSHLLVREAQAAGKEAVK
jgi:tetratricopeptide (TPR) repeat protein